jgi:hypothetical protein
LASPFTTKNFKTQRDISSYLDYLSSYISTL